MYTVAVCDDSARDRAYVAALVQTWAQQKGTKVDLTEYTGAEHFLFQYAEGIQCDILLLDIEMGIMDGVTLAKKLRQQSANMQIVFITGYPDYISEGYEVSALHYLMKPVSQDKLFAVLDRAAAALQTSERMLLLASSGKTVRVPISRVQYVEAFSHTAAVVTATDTIQVKIPISELEKMLGDGFIRCHRSYLVGLKHIARLSKTEVILDNGKALPLSRSAAATVHKAFISYYTGEKDETV